MALISPIRVGSVTPLQVSEDGRTGFATVLYTEKAADLIRSAH